MTMSARNTLEADECQQQVISDSTGSVAKTSCHPRRLSRRKNDRNENLPDPFSEMEVKTDCDPHLLIPRSTPQRKRVVVRPSAQKPIAPAPRDLKTTFRRD